MAEVWKHDEVTVRDVLEATNRRRSKSPRAYTTVMTIMSRLEGKGLLERRRAGKTYVYRPALARREYEQRRAQTQVAELVDEFGDVALAHFATHVGQLDPGRLQELRRLASDED